MHYELQQIQVHASLTSTLDVKCWSTWLRGKRGTLGGHSIRLRLASTVGANGGWAMGEKKILPIPWPQPRYCSLYPLISSQIVCISHTKVKKREGIKSVLHTA